ncbi:pyruvate kinase [Rhizobium alvei]|uniref:Pyruvate kinase n=1 Tax=Rhizobium alvei TaxID=1132659 RepID=A0ABT8YSR8_9HYPH|nr:pyruvate kinase [Rhizobium alvei]MDO6966761.1 pyruvate kinase [Rhizobium alvei]
MHQTLSSHDFNEAEQLLADIRALSEAVHREALQMLQSWGKSEEQAALANLAHYLALRHRDLRILQRRLMPFGLSSLGRLESRVEPTLAAVERALSLVAGLPPQSTDFDPDRFFAGEERLEDASDRLFGAPNPDRRGRIMVTMPSEAADDPKFIADLVRRGMDVARINCAHDDAEVWARMAKHVRAAGAAIGRSPRILMDIAGPKIRTGDVVTNPGQKKIELGNALRLVASGEPWLTEGIAAAATVSLPEIVTRLSVGDRVRYDDGKLEAYVESLEPGAAILRVTRAKAGGAKFKPEKGLNLPDTVLGLSPLTSKDVDDLEAVIANADMIGYSFVSRPDDIDLLEEAIARIGAPQRELGLIAKIEQPEAVRNLPALIATAAGRRPFGVMIARGDLAAEIGFERLAEMQEEILWIAEAASVPVIWATQVLEDLVKEGVPSRGEMTDAAMAARAECVMLNKGPAVGEAVDLLSRLFARMDEHMLKKTPTLRALKSW